MVYGFLPLLTKDVEEDYFVYAQSELKANYAMQSVHIKQWPTMLGITMHTSSNKEVSSMPDIWDSLLIASLLY